MKQSRTRFIFVVCSWFLLGVYPAMAHVGHDEPAPVSSTSDHMDHKMEGDHDDHSMEEMVQPEAENIYAIGGEGTDDFDSLSDPISGDDIFASDSAVPEIAMPSSSPKSHEASGASDEHAGHKMPEIELAEHEFNSTSKKGFGVAMGITLLAGLAFGLLVSKKPGE